MNYRQKIKKVVAEIEIIDTHEHILPEGMILNEKPNIDFDHWFFHYASSDIISAGLSADDFTQKVRNKKLSLEERLALFLPYWKEIKNTGYARALLISAQELLGIKDLNEKTWKIASKKIQQVQKKGWYKEVFKKAGIKCCLRPCSFEEISQCDREIIHPVLSIDQFITLTNKQLIELTEKQLNVSLKTFTDWVNSVNLFIAKGQELGCVGLKSGAAYLRILHYAKTKPEEAEAVFNRIMSGEQLSLEQAKPLQDFGMYEIIKRSIEHQLPFQIHTGIQEGNGNYLTNSNPTHLTNLFLEHPQARFDLFHGGYPYCGEMAVLAKNFPNVYANMCWLHIICPWKAKQVLHEWLDTIPGNKIFGFGGDYIFVEGSYGHSRLARKNITEVLTERVSTKLLTLDEAIYLAHNLLNRNPKKLYKL